MTAATHPTATAGAQPDPNRPINCPQCQSPHRQIKYGKSACGSQKFQCTHCSKVYTPHPKTQGYPKELRHQAVALSIDGMGIRRIARHLGVNPQSVANWIFAHHATLKAQAQADAATQATTHPTTAATAEVIEMDELFTFVGTKKESFTS